MFNELLLTTDAKEWAQEFMDRFGDDPSRIDEGLMIGWFANAIEVGRTAGRIEAGAVFGTKD